MACLSTPHATHNGLAVMAWSSANRTEHTFSEDRMAMTTPQKHGDADVPRGCITGKVEELA